MSDVAEVKEALEWFAATALVHAPPVDFNELVEATQVLAVAARRWVRMVETGEQVEWCETHDAEATDENRFQLNGQCWKWRFKHAPGLCRIVSRLVAAVGVEKETL